MNEYKIQKTKFQIRTANDESIKCQGIISLPMRIGKCEWSEKFFILEGLAHPIILGSKTMRERGIDIEFTKAQIKMICEGKIINISLKSKISFGEWEIRALSWPLCKQIFYR